MEILAFGVQSDEKQLIEKAFAGQHEVRLPGPPPQRQRPRSRAP
ncbi:hypothetical protein ACIA8E_09925 [Streptomyces sp. NPDC051664]